MFPPHHPVHDARMLSRRTLLARACAAPLVPLAAACNRAAAVRSPRPTDIRIVEVDHQFEEFRYRAPYQFGGRTVDRVTILNVNCRVRTGAGREAWGFGSMTLGNAWAFPAVPHEQGLGAMMALASALRNVTANCDDAGHPIDLARALGTPYLVAAADVSRARALPVPDPEALRARRRQRVRRRPSRRVRQGVQDELLRHVRSVVRQPGSVRRSGLGVQGRVSRSLRAVGAAAGDARVSLGWGERSARGERRARADRRRASEHAGGVDSARRPDPLQDQAQRRQPRGRHRSHPSHRSHRHARQRRAARGGLEVPARLQRGLSERAVPDRVPAARARSVAARLRSHSVHRAADVAGSEEGSARTSCTRRQSCGPSSSTSR